MKHILAIGLFVSCVFACGGSTPPPAAPMAPPAADNGQPRMQAALSSLQKAQAEATAAEANKGGHREKALELIQQAIDAVNAGMQYATEHATEAGEPEGPAEPEPVDEEVKGAGNQPHMAAAVVALREARKQLHDAKHDKGGFRDKAIGLSKQAIEQLKEGIRFADHH
jgi:hypothetical protein